jgi:hypothetical protein
MFPLPLFLRSHEKMPKMCLSVEGDWRVPEGLPRSSGTQAAGRAAGITPVRAAQVDPEETMTIHWSD